MKYRFWKYNKELSISWFQKCGTGIIFSWKSNIDENWSLNYHTTYKNDQNLLENCNSATATYRALRWDYGLNKRPTTQAIDKNVKKFEEAGMVTNIPRPFRSFAKNIAIACESIAEGPNVSILHRSQKLGLFYGILWRILHLGLHLHPCKVQHTQQLKPANHS